MSDIAALPVRGDVFVDTRDAGRVLRASWHHESGVVVLSLWRGGSCVGTFQLDADEVPALIGSLAGGLAEGYRDSRGSDSHTG